MKKLLSLLTISTLATSVPATLLANTPLTRILTSNSNDEYLPLKEISYLGHNVNSIAIDSKENIYFGTDVGAFVLKQGETTAIKIDVINGLVLAVSVDSKDNIYFGLGTKKGAFVFKHGATTATPINGINSYFLSATLSLNGNLYFGTNDIIYFLQTALSWVKQQSQFNLVDSTKKWIELPASTCLALMGS